MFSQSLLFFFSSLGVFNALFLAALLLLSKPVRLSDKFLAGLLVLLCIRVGKSVLYYFDPTLSVSYLQLGMSACLLIGPVAYFYTLSALGKLSVCKPDWRFQLAFWGGTIVIIGFLFPFSQFPEYWKKSHLVIYHVWLLYLLMAGWELRDKLTIASFKQLKVTDGNSIVLYVFAGNLLIWFSYYSFKLTSYIVGALSFSFIVFLSILLVLHGKFSDPKATRNKYINKDIDEQEIADIKLRAGIIMSDEKLFTDPNLKMADLAKLLRISPQKLSQILNNNLGKSFKQYVNEYRIEFAKKLLINDQRITVELLSERCGFNSTSTFHEAFKKHTGSTPVVFRKGNVSSDN